MMRSRKEVMRSPSGRQNNSRDIKAYASFSSGKDPITGWMVLWRSLTLEAEIIQEVSNLEMLE